MCLSTFSPDYIVIGRPSHLVISEVLDYYDVLTEGTRDLYTCDIVKRMTIETTHCIFAPLRERRGQHDMCNV